MTIPTTIAFRGLEPSDALSAAIVEHVGRLERFAGDIISCQVTVSSVEHRHQQGNRYNVHIRVCMRGQDIEAGRTPDPNRTHEDPYVALADSFDALQRRIEDYVRRRRGDTKTHHTRPEP